MSDQLHVALSMAFQIKNISKLLDIKGDVIRGRGVVGIDIGTSTLKVVGMTEGSNGPALETYGEMQLPPYANADIGSIANLEPGNVAKALNDIVKEASVTARTGALAIPHSASFVAVTRLAGKEQNELAAMVPVEARKLVPMAMNEIRLDWFPVPDQRMKGESAAPRTAGTDVVIAAVYTEAEKRFKNIVQRIGIAVAHQEIEAFSTVRASVHEDDKTVMVVDCGASGTKMYVVQDGILRETHRMPVGGSELTSSVMQVLGTSFVEAEEAKRAIGFVSGGVEPRVGEALQGPIERIITDMKRVIMRYEQHDAEQVSKIILTGGGASLIGLREAVEATLSLPTEHAHPFAKMEYPAFLESTLREIGPSFSGAIGAGLFHMLA
jgi:type IV pilus assembly protein PilM